MAQSQSTLTSLWDGLNEHLQASFYEVEKIDTDVWQRKSDSVVVKAPLLDANLELGLQWQSPFESAGPETKAPALFSMLQSGSLQPVVDALFGRVSEENSVQQQTSDFLTQFEGRTGITKLNSTQVFNGMEPMKISAQVLFRAWRDAAKEVEAPMNQLVSWALPVELSKDASIAARAAQTARGDMDYIDALMPSRSPIVIGMTYKGRTYMPLVIESIGVPLSSPINSDGKFVHVQMPITLCSLTAIDRQDWANTTVKTL